MLYRETVEPLTLELLIELSNCNPLTNYFLVGGTALSLQIGHRISVDLDFFGQGIFPIDEFRMLSNKFSSFESTRIQGPIYQFFVNKVKVDIVEYPYPWIDAPIIFGGIRMASDKDIAAMKVNAITNRGTKKDFVDLYALLLKYSYPEIMSFYEIKYPDGNKMLAIRFLNYFDDAEGQEVNILWDISWEEIKRILTEKYLEYFNSL